MDVWWKSDRVHFQELAHFRCVETRMSLYRWRLVHKLRLPTTRIVPWYSLRRCTTMEPLTDSGRGMLMDLSKGWKLLYSAAYLRQYDSKLTPVCPLLYDPDLYRLNTRGWRQEMQNGCPKLSRGNKPVTTCPVYTAQQRLPFLYGRSGYWWRSRLQNELSASGDMWSKNARPVL